MDLSDPVFDRESVDVFLVLAIAESAFQSDELMGWTRPAVVA